MNIFVLHPHKKISIIQRKLMSTVKEKNVFNIAIEGNFDDCQNLVKSMFADQELDKEQLISPSDSLESKEEMDDMRQIDLLNNIDGSFVNDQEY